MKTLAIKILTFYNEDEKMLGVIKVLTARRITEYLSLIHLWPPKIKRKEYFKIKHKRSFGQVPKFE